MLQTRIPNPREIETPSSEFLSLRQTISAAFALIVRQYPLMIFVLLLCVSLASVFLMTAPKRYTSTAALIIDSRKMQGLQQQSVGSDTPIDSSMVDSQVEILKSETIALAVIKDLRLVDDAEFTGSEGGLLSGVFGLFTSLFPDPPRSDYVSLRIALTRFQSRLTIKRLGMSYVIEISYQSQSPARAAAIANAVAEAYIVDSLESKYQASRRAAVWLQDRMKELRAQASTAERAVADYKAKNNIVDAGGRLLTEQQLAEINSSLTVARSQRAEAQARLGRITAILKSDDDDRNVILNDLATVTDTMQNPVITKLRQTYLDYAAKESDWANRYGSTHLAVVNLRNQMREIRHSIKDELRRTAESYKSDLEIAKSREEASQKSLNDTIALSNDTSQAQIVLRDLESNAQSARALADNFLQLYMVSVQQQSFPITEARVITQASVPLTKSSPKTLLILLAAIAAGTILAALTGVLRDMMDRVFRTISQVEQLLHVPCLASIPAIDANGSQAVASGTFRAERQGIYSRLWAFAGRRRSLPASDAGRSGPNAPFMKVESGDRHPSHGDRLLVGTKSVGRAVINSPFSRFAEGVRSIKLAADLANFGSSNKVLGVTSALPNEGKSTISEALAQVSAQSGARTILVDGDIRNPSLTARLSPDAQYGLIDLVLGKSDLQSVVWVDPQTGLHFLPCVIASRFSNSGDMLASPQMQGLFRQLNEQYDRIVLDLSPLAPVIDVRATGSLVGSYILVLEWARAKIDIVERVLNEAPVVRERLLGAVLNKVNLAVMNRYDLHQGGYYYNKYYQRYGYVD
ncbi:Wzz/FepE/Etk N-terminal domain-containing protein [Bradyrhizobium sp. SSUT112]|uniref:Wzz/FepE/Etk N-terminal domain-containing protein n=1 Tax=Bradyrhizobium sp. SSUT112 TaxID=3040604 RepID=UPI002447D34C|nr:Wzz/FepE/Etk N-terminal domain-containing protein [Bradyrhizobium sp. SSUT112]MDH2356828.1 Wzz/FepE/Etk N-terminal domain-containing protein [Bradyrhizobium sp. SSUT112]